jgi:hypothetical protein
MMRYFFCTLCLLLCITTIGQTHKIGYSLSPNYAYRVRQSDNPIFATPTINEIPKIGYRASVSYERAIHKRVSFFVGVSFTNNGYQTEEFELRYSTMPPPNAPRATSTRTSLYQFGIPIGVNLFFPIKKVKLFLSAGASTQYLARIRNTNFRYTIDNRTEKSTSNGNKGLYKPLSFAAFGSFGIEFNVVKNMAMRIAPNTHYTFTNIMDNDVAYEVYPTSAGISIGIWYDL